MADFPSLPLWTDAYLADTTDLSAEEHGVYLLLLMAAWRTPTCSLPDDDERLARMAKVGAKKWRKLRPVMERFFTVEDGQWTQNRLLKERDRVETSRSQKRQAAHAKHAKNKDNGSAGAGAADVRKPCNPYPEPYPEESESNDSLSESAENTGSVVAMPERDEPKRVAEHMAQIWNEECGDVMRRVRNVAERRRKMAAARFRDDLGGDFEAWRGVCQRIRGSPFLRGEVGNWNGADFDWCIRPNNLPNIMEGKYDPQPPRKADGPQQPANKALAAFARYRATAGSG
jgi:uncharacterized protein YdaU (DUF1376 family)